jgi:Xaa-Pro dipeptidase
MGYFEDRIEKVKQEMKNNCIDALVAMKPQNSFYLSEFNGIIYSRPIPVVVPMDGDPAIIVPRLRVLHAKEESKVKDIREYVQYGEKPRDPIDMIKEVLDERGVTKGNIGVETDFIPNTEFEKLKKRLPDFTFKAASDIFRRLRMVKDEKEIENIRKASEISDSGMEAAVREIKLGKTEIEVAFAAKNAMMEKWKNKYPDDEIADFGGTENGIPDALWCWCLSGPRIWLVCDDPTTRRIGANDGTFTVISATINGYHCENERNGVEGKPTRRQQELSEAAWAAAQAAVEKMRVGSTCSEVTGAALDVYRKRDLGKYILQRMTPRIGHSIGLGWHEFPSLHLAEGTILQRNMVFAVEPGLHIEGVGGFGTSDTVLVTEDGGEFLTKYNMQHPIGQE